MQDMERRQIYVWVTKADIEIGVVDKTIDKVKDLLVPYNTVTKDWSSHCSYCDFIFSHIHIL